MSLDIETIGTNIDRGRAVLRTASSAMALLDQSAAVLQQAVDAKEDFSSAVELWRVDGRSNSVAIDSVQRRKEELRVWPALASQVQQRGSWGARDWRGVSNVVQAVANSNPLGLAVTSGITLLDDWLQRRVHEAGYERLQLTLGRGLIGLDQTFGSGLSELGEKLEGEISDLNKTTSRGLEDLGEKLGGEISDLNRTISSGLEDLGEKLGGEISDLNRTISSGLEDLGQTLARGFQNLTVEFSWGLSGLLWLAEQQNETMAEIRDVLTRPLDVQSKELRARAIVSYERGWIDEAQADFLDAMEKSRVDYIVAHYLGNIYLLKEQYDSAANWFGKSARYSRPEEPRHAAVALMHQALAYSLRSSGEEIEDWRLATACLDQAMELDPTNVEMCFQRAHCLARTGASKSAIDALEIVIDHDGRYLAKVLMEPDFKPLDEEIANLVYWLTRSYARTIEAEFRRLAPFLKQIIEGITTDSADAINLSIDDAGVEAYLDAISFASWLYSCGDLYSVQQAQNLLLMLDRPALRTKAKVSSRSKKKSKSSSTRSGYAEYGYYTAWSFGVGGDLL
jgi:tetratricopeptide (TPR) repeat protein